MRSRAPATRRATCTCTWTGERQPIIAKDVEGTGFACDTYYQLHVGDDGRPLNGDSALMLEVRLHISAAHILELRKLNGKQRVLRHSFHANDASRCMAVIAPLVEQAGRWLPD
eukprot:6495126-Prymnesium_polylepis.2